MSIRKTKEITSLEKLPRVGSRHTWADYVELLCLFNIDREMSKDVLIDRFKEGRDKGEDLDNEIDDSEDETGAESTPDASNNDDDNLDAKAEELFRHLKYREGTFGKSYPFAVDMAHRRLTLKRTTGRSRIYLFLLLASNLRYFHPMTHLLTTDFEALSKLVLERLLPGDAKVYFFNGAGRSGRYKGRLFQKLTILASDLFETMSVAADDFDENDVGDGGLDLVGWVPMADSSPGLLLCLAQCACTDTWVKKQRETMAVHQAMTIKATPVRVTFIPFCFRRPTGGWFYNHSVETVVIDRLRIVNLLGEGRLRQPLASLKEIGELIKRTEAVI